MWFRIETNKDGSIKSCVEVEAALKDGRQVHYINADSKEQAITLLAGRWARARETTYASRQRLKATRRKARLCVDCGEPAEKDRVRCARHLAKVAERVRRVTSGAADPLKRSVKLEGEDAAAAQARKQKYLKDYARESKQGSRYYYLRMIKELRTVLDAFDGTTPRAFRVWLVERILHLEEQLARRVARHESAAAAE